MTSPIRAWTKWNAARFPLSVIVAFIAARLFAAPASATAVGAMSATSNGSGLLRRYFPISWGKVFTVD
jgi:hypothetical protein